MLDNRQKIMQIHTLLWGLWMRGGGGGGGGGKNLGVGREGRRDEKGRKGRKEREKKEKKNNNQRHGRGWLFFLHTSNLCENFDIKFQIQYHQG